MKDHFAVDGGGVLRALSPAVGSRGTSPAFTGLEVSRTLAKLDIKGRLEFAVLALGALLIAGAYIVVPLVTALYSLVATVFAALTLGVAIVTQLALLVMYVVRRTGAPRASRRRSSGIWPGRNPREAKA